MIRRGTTPTLWLRVDTDLTGFDVWMTLQQGRNQITIESPRVRFDGRDSVVSARLDQEQTLSLEAGKFVQVQVRAVMEGTAVASEICTQRIDDVLLDGVLPDIFETEEPTWISTSLPIAIMSPLNVSLDDTDFGGFEDPVDPSFSVDGGDGEDDGGPSESGEETEETEETEENEDGSRNNA